MPVLYPIGARGLFMPWDQNFRYGMHWRHSFWNQIKAFQNSKTKTTSTLNNLPLVLGQSSSKRAFQKKCDVTIPGGTAVQRIQPFNALGVVGNTAPWQSRYGGGCCGIGRWRWSRMRGGRVDLGLLDTAVGTLKKPNINSTILIHHQCYFLCSFL